MTVDLDRIARDKIISDIHENYFVEAGAGSGKTTVLVARMVSMVESGIDISKICAITFTKAAAAEFYERFEKALSQSQNPYAKKALQDIDLCFLGTIDSFCNTVLSEHPAIAGIPSDAQNADEEERKRLIEREYLRIRRGEYGEDPAKAVNEFSASFYNHRDLFTGLILLFNGSKNLRYTIPDLDGRKKELSLEKTRIMKYLSILNKHPEYLSGGKGSADSREAAETLSSDFWMLLRSWEKYSGSVQTVLKSLESLRIDPSSMDLLGLGWGDYFEEHQRSGKTDYCTVKKGAFTAPVKEYRYALAMNAAAKTAPMISAVLKREGKLNFDDYLVYLRDILKKDAASGGKLIRHIRERHHYFLIDEFQDTNPIQAEIFFYLCAKEVKDDWRKCIPEKGTLFIVGDPKQSIYRFRNADVASYLKIREMFKGEVGEVLTLTRNFRSTDKLCGFFNEAFCALLPEDTADQSRYREIPVGEKQPYTAVFNGVYKYHTADVTYAKDSDDPSLVTSVIAKIRHNPKLMIQDRDRNGTAQPPRVPEYRDFMVITPGKPVLRRYMKEFYDRGIPFRVEGEVSFGECPSLRSMRLLLEAVSDPSGPNAVYALRHFSGLKTSEEDLRSYAADAEVLSPSALLEKLIDVTDVYKKAGVDNAEYLRYALELLRSWEIDGTVGSLKDAVTRLGKLIDENNDIERCPQFTDSSDRVHLANLHKVKGLEEAIVILASPFRTKKDPEMHADHSGETPEAVLFSLSDKKRQNAKLIETTLYPNELEKEKEILEAEKDRLLYVAATRAANVLIISTREGTTKKFYEDPWLFLAERAHDDLFEYLDRFPDPPIEEEEPYVEEKEILYTPERSLPSTYHLRRPSEHRAQILSEEEKEEEEAKQVFHHGKKDATLIGTMVHRVMEILVLSKNTTDEEELVSYVMKENHTEEYGDLLQKVIKTVRSGGYPQKNDAPKDILKELLEADEVHPELPFTYRKNDEIWSGIMDVVYRKDGVWHIVDYKTNADPNDLDERYQEQLSAYIEAFQTITGEKADALIYHIDV